MHGPLPFSPVSEDKVLTHPSSVDSIPTSAGQEDHVSMGGFAARKALTVVEHAETGTYSLICPALAFFEAPRSPVDHMRALFILTWPKGTN